MSVWDLATIGRVERLYTKVDVDRSIEGRPGATDSIARELTSALRSEAHALAVEIHPDDVKVHRSAEDDNLLTVEYVAHWQPGTGRCELRGGALDGTMYDTRLDRHDPLRVPSPTAAFEIDEYEVVGWSEEGRHWVRTTR